MSTELWVEKYRPETLDEYVWKNEHQRAKVEQWLSEGALPHILLAGSPGTGKTSLANLMLKRLGIPKGDILEKNASRERKIDQLQDSILNFCSTWPLNDTGFKYVLLNEADRLSPLSQDFMRDEMERYVNNVRFILTCNNPARINEALHSRVTEMKFYALDRDEFTARAGEVLVKEDVIFEIDDLIAFVNLTYPDLRKCIGLLQYNSKDGRLNPPAEDQKVVSGRDYLVDVAHLFRSGRWLEGRKMIIENAQVEEYVDLYRYFYQNLDLWGEAQDQQDDALMAIRRALVNHNQCGDPEINLAATLVELTNISRGK